jgi:hypothetical protein
MIKINVADLEAHNNGYLVCKRITLPIDSKILNEKISDILLSGEVECDSDHPHEEVFITDWEWESLKIFQIYQYDNIHLLNEKAIKLSKLTPYQLEAVRFLLKEGLSLDLDHAIDSAFDVVIHKNKTMENIAYYRVSEMMGMKNLPDIIMKHMDFKSMGEDIRKSEYFVIDGDTIYEYIGE